MPAFTRLPVRRLQPVAAPTELHPAPEPPDPVQSSCYQRHVRDLEPNARLLADQALVHLDALYAFAWRLSRNDQVAEDLVQDTMFRCLARGQGFAPGTDLKAWLFRILRNAFLDLRRREGRAPVRSMAELPESGNASEDALPTGPGAVNMEPLRRLVARDIDAALDSLSDDQRMVVLLDLEGFSEQEIAEVVACAPGTVKSRLARARAALRVQLREYAT
jgi:RNA polymerase sigma-70 factor (ECF subfamily)